MIRRAIVWGLIGGLLITLGAIYPSLTVFAPALYPAWTPPLRGPVTHAVLLMGSSVVALAALVLAPLAAALGARGRGFMAGAQLGAVTALFMGTLVCVMVVLPLNNIAALPFLQPYYTPLADPPSDAILNYVLRLFSLGGNLILISLGGSTLFGALLGGFANLVRGWGQPGPARPTLYELAKTNNGRQWFAENDQSTVAALVVGAGVGLVFAFSELQSLYAGFDSLWPELRPLIAETLGGLVVVRLIPFPPLAALSGLLMGGVVVAAVKNPTGRFWERVLAVMMSMDVAMLFWFLHANRTATFYLGISPFLTQRGLAELPAEYVPTAEMLAVGLAAPATQVLLAFLTPWLFLPAAAIGVALIGLVLGVVYAAIVPLLMPRPIDFAHGLSRRLKAKPEDTLHLLYGLFNRQAHAYDILAHLVPLLGRRLPDTSRLAAAFHTLGTAAPTGEAAPLALVVGEAAELVARHPEWRMSKEIASADQSLAQLLKADSLEALLQVTPPAEMSTTNVPPLIVKSIQHLTAIIMELHKVNRVDDLPTRLTFLNNTLAAISRAQQFVEADMRDPKQAAAPYPERPALALALKRWEQMVIAAAKRLQGRAAVAASLKSNRVTPAARLPITFVLTNEGLNVAERVRLRLLPGADYYVAPPGEAGLDILPAGGQQELTLFVEPRAEAPRLRLEWEVAYDDSVEKARAGKFADVAEFVQPDKPFQRIFPIPYVTGTPLKDGQVFVGRQDIFDFVKENLIGATQNNVIILHGQRRTGKTSVLYRLGHTLKDTHVAVLIDMQGKPARGEAEFLFSIADDIVYALEQNGLEVALPDRKDFDESPEFFFRSRFLRGLYPVLGQRNLLLLFDEFEELQRRVDDGRLDAGIFQFLRNLMQHEAKVDFIFTGTHKLEELGSDYWSVLFNIAIYKRITFLAPAEVRRLMLEPVARYNLEYDPLAVDTVMALTAGHPYFTQILLHEIIVYHNESQRTYITAADIEQAVERVLERGEAHFKYIWTESTPDEQKAMRVLAEALVGKTEINAMDIRAFCDACGLSLGPEHVEAMTSLVSRDIVSQRGRLYRFTVPLVERWVRRTHPVMA